MSGFPHMSKIKEEPCWKIFGTSSKSTQTYPLMEELHDRYIPMKNRKGWSTRFTLERKSNTYSSKTKRGNTPNACQPINT